MKKDVSPWDSSISLGPGQSIYMDEKLAKSYSEQRKALREIRGNVMALSIEIELLMDQVIKVLFYPTNLGEPGKIESLKKLFDKLVLKERPMTFNGKISLFRNLCKEHHLLAGENLEDLITNLDVIRDTRNRFAHNTLAFFPEGDPPDQKLIPKLTCYDKEIVLNSEYFDGLNDIYRKTHEGLETLLKKLT